jgi:hypothetical protein
MRRDEARWGPNGTDDRVLATYLLSTLVPRWKNYAVRTGDTWLLNEERFYKYCWRHRVTVESAIARARYYGWQIEQTPEGYVVSPPPGPVSPKKSKAKAKRAA